MRLGAAEEGGFCFCCLVVKRGGPGEKTHCGRGVWEKITGVSVKRVARRCGGLREGKRAIGPCGWCGVVWPARGGTGVSRVL